jgi:signal transduction histidine kinase/CheY-like chemotaxis protein
MIEFIKKIPGLRSSIGRRFILYILLFSSVITFMGTGLQLYLDYDRDVELIHTSLKQVESSYLYSITNSLWVTDYELLHMQLEGILRLPDMQFIEVRNGTEVLQAVGTPQSESIIEQTIPLVYDYNGRDVHLGELYVVASLKGVYARTLDRVLVILGIQTIKTFLVSLFIFIIFYLLVGKYITYMASFVESIHFESMDQPLHLDRKPKKKKPDELDRLVTSFNRMRENLARDIIERETAEKELQESEKKLRIRNRIANVFLTIPDDKMYGEILGIVLEAMKSKYGVFGYIGENGALVCPSLTRDIWDQCQIPDKDIVFPRDTWDGIWGKALIEKTALYSNESFKVPEGHVPVMRALDVPIIYQEEAIGNLLVGNKETNYVERDQELLEEISEYIAPVLSARLQRDKEEKDRKRVEKDLRKSEEKLAISERMEAMGTLAGGIAHDFNNLLMAIQGRTSIMLMKKDSSHPDIRHLKGIEGNIENAADLTRQLLGFARGGKYEVKTIDINELVKKQNRMFGRTKKEISIRGKYEENLWSVEVDRGQIEQVLLNLYVNAWQAMPGGGDLYLETENVTLDEIDVEPFSIEPGEYVKISVTDTGVGMDKATREKVFEPFFTTKEMGRGTGLGLASAYGIIKNHGGFINVYSEKGHGATFNIYLPASEKEIIEEKRPAGDTLRGTETVLIVDDEDMIVEVAEELFDQLGYKVLIAGSGREAIETYEKNKEKIDIVLLDMIMPNMSGGETYDKLKEINPDVKVLLASGYSMIGTATEIMDRGCNGFIQKPFKMKELSQKLREILDEK